MAGILSEGITISVAEYTGSTLGSYSVVPNLQQIPDLGGDAEQVDVTCLEHSSYHYIPGIKDYGSLDFLFLYDNSTASSNYRVLKNLEGEVVSFKVEFPDAVSTSGNGTTFVFDGIPHCKINSAGVNAALQFTCSIALQSDITVTDAN